MKHRPGRLAAILLLVLAVAWLAPAAAAPTVTFEMDPPNPVAGQVVRLRDTSPTAATAWVWDFGDGSSADTASPSHAWSEPGTYAVRLVAQDASSEKTITVSPQTTLRLLAAHPFEIAIDAKDPGTGGPSPARAVAISDRFGWFSFPGLTNDPGNPEVTVKVLEAPTFGRYWVFWSAMTSLEYTMTVRDALTGQVQVYEKTDPAACGGWDTSSFPSDPTTTPTPSAHELTPTAATATPMPGQPTRTWTPRPPATPTASRTPTVTPTPGQTQLVLRATSWQWDWCPAQLPCTPGICPYAVGPGTRGNNEITLHMGCSYTLTMYNGDSDTGDQTQPHETNSPSGPNIGFPAYVVMPPGVINPTTFNLTVPTGSPADISFSCFNSGCANGGPPESTHELMTGVIHIAP